MIEKNIRNSAENLVLSTATRIETVLRPIEKITQNTVYILESSPFDRNTILKLLFAEVANNDEIYGSTAALEPYALGKDTPEFAPYYYKSGGELNFKYLKDHYRYFYLDWYQIPKELDRAVWSSPYYDEGGGDIMMATYSVPIHTSVEGKKKFIGVVTADISLSWLRDIVSSIKIGKTGYGFLISKGGRIITHPTRELVMNETIFDIAESREDPGLRAIGKEMIKGSSGFVLSKSIVTGKKCWLAYAPLHGTGWSLGVIFPQDELMSDIVKLNGVVLFIGIAGFLFLLIVIMFISRSITLPIRTLHKATKDIAKGDLDFKLPHMKSDNEVGELAGSFIYMRTALKQYIKELTETTAAKARIDSELRIAHNIQLSLVPKVFPPYPDRREFDIYAALEPAKEVGGDFYDFFFVDDTHFCVIIGDVVGKGVPAALLMAVVKTLIKTYAIESKNPSITLTKVNKELSDNSASCMFVSIFIGILDTKTGSLSYSNAGHNPPVLMKKGGEPMYINNADEMAIGLDEKVSYHSETLSLSEGDMLCLYTDGVTEAFNEKRELFSEERLLSALKTSDTGHVKDTVTDVLSSIKSFAGSHAQSDDITMLLIKIN
jgi:sigma-B regulation protein RsbU (phosphoserine phosphatase)